MGFIRRTHALLLVTLVFWACSDNLSSPDADGDDDGLADLRCKRLDYPCTLGEVPPSVLDQGRALADEALNRLREESSDAVVTWLEGQQDVVAAGSASGAVRFRLDGGRPHWVLSRRALKGSSGGSSPGGAARPPAATGRAPRGVQPDVVGKDRTGEGVVNNRDRRRALVLSPFLHQLADDDEGPLVRDKLRGLPAYGAVDFQKDEEVGAEDFAGWENYDVVHVSSHSMMICEGDTCMAGIAAGVTFDPSAHGDQIGLSPGFVDLTGGEEREIILVEADFFRNQYPDGLSRTLIVFSGCITAVPESDGRVPDVALALVGGDFSSLYLGWTEVLSVAAGAFDFLYDRLGQDGLPVRRAIQLAYDEEVLPVDPPGDPANDLVVHGHAGTDLRIREVVAIGGTETDSLHDGDDITGLVSGTPEDGEDDRLIIDAVVDGVRPDEAGNTSLRFELDGESIGQPTPVSAGQQFEGADYRWSLHVTDLGTGRDLQPDRPYTLEAIVELPEGGTSRYEARELNILPCFWEMQLDGGGLDGDHFSPSAWWFPRIGGGIMLQFNPAEDADPELLFEVLLYSAPTGVTDAFQIGSDTEQEGVGTLTVLSGAPQRAYQTGDGSPVRDPEGNIIGHQPPPSDLIFTDITDRWLVGTFSGTVWTQVGPEELETVQMDLRFRAEKSMDEAGNPIFDACGGR